MHTKFLATLFLAATLVSGAVRADDHSQDDNERNSILRMTSRSS